LRYRPNPLFFLLVYEVIKRMVSVRAIFLASIAGDTLLQDSGLLPSKEPLPFFFGRLEVKFQVLALCQAIKSLAPFADFHGKLQITHGSGSSCGLGITEEQFLGWG
jgi:hypothetical protein